MKNFKHPTSWEPVAAWYDDLLKGEDTYQSKVIFPNLLRLLPATKGKRIIDIACGQGFFSTRYAELGAAVVGVDISSELIKRAQAHELKNKTADLKFEVAPASKLTAIPSESFDGGMIILALQNIKELQETLSEASRVLVKGGTFVIVLNHPCFRIPKGSMWGYDEQEKVQYRRIDRYGVPFKAEIDMMPSKMSRAIQTASFHRPLQEYVKAFSKAGFSLTGLEEWISHKTSQKGPRAEAEDRARKEFPMFMTLVLRKD